MHLNVYMLRPGLSDDDWGLRETIAEFDEVSTRVLGQLDPRLFLRQSPGNPPRWLRNLVAVMEDQDLSRLINVHSAALLQVQHRGYKFVLVFGTGRFAIDPGAVQPGFGLKVVVNAVAAGRCVSVDTRELGGRGKSQRTAMSVAGPLDELGIEPTRAWVRQLEGRPPVEFANAVAGSDSLRLNLRRFSLSNLEEKLDQIIERYESADYKREYEFIDFFTRVEDGPTNDRLRERLTEMLVRGGSDVSFASPDIDEPLEVEFYVLRHAGHKGIELPELLPDDVLAALSRFKTNDPLKDVRVEAYDSSGSRVGHNYKLLNYIMAEVELDDRRYALSAGQWFVVDQGFVDKIDRAIGGIDDLTDELSLDPWKRGAHIGEGDYNSQLALNRKWRLLDRQNFHLPASYQKIEICDLLTERKQLLCVKRMTRSSTLSHLFMQGQVSAQLLTANLDGYRDRIMLDMKQIDSTATFGTNSDWTLVYAIATPKPGSLASSLYFFSKIALYHAVQQLRSLGVRVAIARIPME